MSHHQLKTESGQCETILLVEDEAAVRTFTRAVLEANGYRVLAAADGSEALTIAQGHPGAIQLLLADVVLPRLGGRQLAERLLQERPGMKVLLTSGYVEDTADPFLQKPFGPAMLTQKVRQVLDDC